MPARLHPGVYVEEVPSGARSIEAVGTSTAIFVGETERGPITPTLIHGIADYDRLFGGHQRLATPAGEVPPTTRRLSLRLEIEAFFQNGGTSAYVLRALAPLPVVAGRDVAATSPAPSGPPLSTTVRVAASSPGQWGNSVSAVFAASSNPARFKIYVFYKAPGATNHALMEVWDQLSGDPSDENYMPRVLARSLFVRSAETREFSPTTLISGAPSSTDVTSGVLASGDGGDVDGPFTAFSTLLPALDGVTDASLLVVPAPFNAAHLDAHAVANAALAYAEVRPRQDLFCIADLPRLNATTASGYVTEAKRFFLGDTVPDPDLPPVSKTTFGAVYGPWVEVADPIGLGRDPTVFVGPSGFIAGLFARIDQRRGVWKAPAGTEAALLGARRPEHHLLDAHQDTLNPLGINVVRVMPAGGNVVWGARTLVPASEWRYVPVRRTAIMIRTSVYNSIQWAVFEPNNETLWSSLRLSIGAFMDQLFRQGAFAGATAKEGYFVKCDAETTTADERAAGIVNVWVGFAPLRPAEFVVVKLSQMTSQKA